MKIEVKVPAVGESVTEATIGSWSKQNGEFVKRNDVLLLLETDKASVEVVAENDGVITITVPAGQTVAIGAVIASIDTDGKASAGAPAASSAAPAPSAPSAPSAQPAAAAAKTTSSGEKANSALLNHLSPAVNRIVTEKGLDPAAIEGTGKGGRLTKADVMSAEPAMVKSPAAAASSASAAGGKEKKPEVVFAMPTKNSGKQGDKTIVPMTTIRKKTAQRLVEAKTQAAILTTFNEIDLTKVNEIRNKYKDKYKDKYGLSLGMMGFFTKAAVEALKQFPAVNAWVTGENIEYHNYYNIGIAVSTEKGLMVPVIKDVDQMSIPEIEMAIRHYALKARDGKIGIDDLSGGTFSITNGGVFGSLMSTPILNYPQSAILGMHKSEDRAVVVNGQIVIRNMMYVALSYDHRMIDGKDSVSFLVKIKELVEDPERLLIQL